MSNYYHRFIAGVTQSGKTNHAISEAMKVKAGVLFFNPQKIKMPKSFININCDDDMDIIKVMLSDGEKFNYILHHNDEAAKIEIDHICHKLFEYRVKHVKDKCKPIVIVLDESHIFLRNNQRSPVLNIATRGLRYDLILWSITQSPSLTHNILFTQAQHKTYFKIEDEDIRYFKNQGIPMDEIQAQVRANGKYSYIEKYDGAVGGFKDGYTKPHIDKLIN